MNAILNEINKLAFIISPIFYKILAMSWSALLITVIMAFINRHFKKKIPFVLKKTIVFLVIIVMIIPLRFESKLSFNHGAVGSFEAVSYRKQYDQAEQELFLAKQKTDNSDEYAAQIEMMEKHTNKYFQLSLLFDIILPLVWLAGVIINGAVRITLAYTFNRNILRSKITVSPKVKCSFEKNKKLLEIKQNIKVVVQNQVRYPAVTGVFKPVIILPEYIDDCNEETIDYIMLHELAHIKQGDLIINSILFVQNIIYWYFSYIFTLIREEMEKLNDEYVIRYLDNEQRKEYSKSLVFILAKCNNISIKPKLLGMTDNKNNIKKRIELIKKDKISKQFGIIGCAVIVALVCFLAFTKDTGRNDLTNYISSYKDIEYITVSRSDRDYEFVYSTATENGADIVKLYFDGITKSDDITLPGILTEVYDDLYSEYEEKYIITLYLKERQRDGNNKSIQFRINSENHIITTVNDTIYRTDDLLKALISELNAVVISENKSHDILDKYNKEIEFIEAKHGFKVTELDGFTFGVIKTEAAINLDNKDYKFSEMMTEFAYAIAAE